jgi:lipoprotein-anchoring transpeptidase ErfK/SrfK
MNAELLQAQKAIQNAREALRDGNHSVARRWAEQAAKLTPHLEDPWLILAAVSSPQESIAFIERALNINPESPRAHKGMQWALKRLQDAPPEQNMALPFMAGKSAVKDGRAQNIEQKKPDETTKQVKAAKRRPEPKKNRRMMVYPALLLVFGCVVLLFAAWTASASPALASILNSTLQPNGGEHPQVWARVEISKPAKMSVAAPVLAEAQPTLPPATLTDPPPTFEPIAAPPTATFEPESEPQPTVPPEASPTPSDGLVLEIIEDTPEPTAAPAHVNPPAQPQNPPVGNGVHWIEVNLSEQRVYAWEGDVLMNSFLVSTGTWATPTVTGTFSIWHKTPLQAMSGPGYYLPDVPYVMYFYKDYALHGTYWHNNFGTPMSHGCVNLTIPDSEWLYNWASYGTKVKVHY